ncbi:L-serine ammonia-lyase, iron-sulfur-dependent subunit beta [Cohnella thailandensis]|uniref:L-serine deaminase n=1 Tax=Cohnella thailandensis TaxID=557557 RepID=A0A841SXU7_9BACL|nr:L-serine ammonia-lyase, iron-sulfur-dependent subunit beta [Cohnella thailandensis]MBB6635025.1 L-serine ammonia-lyase, iron-sulfur-dependent, subunit beta [Cohnella thailandensis]
MRFKDVFSIIGPSMIGPSSSHTAGAVRIGRAARQALGEQPLEAEISLYGSFAETYRGHGTDVALVSGLLDYGTDDERIPDALSHAASAGMQVKFRAEKKPEVHPNTVSLSLGGSADRIRVKGCSIGGGNVEIVGIDRFDARFGANQPTLLVFHEDRAGMIAEMSGILLSSQVNISHMQVDRESRNGAALTVIECDQLPGSEELRRLGEIAGVRKVRLIDLSEKEGTE